MAPYELKIHNAELRISHFTHLQLEMYTDSAKVFPFAVRFVLQVYSAMSLGENSWITRRCILLVGSWVWYTLKGGCRRVVSVMVAPVEDSHVRFPDPEHRIST